mgnify:CR=1 FL=1
MVGGADGIFMEAVAEVASAKPGALFSVDGGEVGLGGDGFAGINGVGVVEGGDVMGFGNGTGGIEGDAVGGGGVEPLKAVHVVGDGYRSGGVGAGVLDVIPGGPSAGVGGKEGGVGVEDGMVGLVTPGTEEIGFLRGGIGEEAKGLVGVGGEDDGIEGKGLTGLGAEIDGFGAAGDRDDGVGGDEGSGKGLAKGVDVGGASADYGLPDRAILERKEAVVPPEMEEGGGGELLDIALGGGPDGGGHRDDEFPDDGFGAANAGEVVGEGDVADGFGFEVAEGAAAEPEDPGDEKVVGGPEEVGPAGEESGQAVAAVAVAGGGGGIGEGHVAPAPGDVEALKQAMEEGVVFIVEDDEAGVDRGSGVRAGGEGYGVGMTAEPGFAFDEGDAVMFLEEMGRGDASDTGPDHRDRGAGRDHEGTP